ncbi:DNA-binding transcriptional regulator [soil metagenome]
MTQTKQYRSAVYAAIHETATDLFDSGFIDKETMRHFDEASLVPVPVLAPEEIKAIREHEHVSQSIFAIYLNVSKSLVSQWERGEKKPAGPSLKLLSLVQRNGLDSIR